MRAPWLLPFLLMLGCGSSAPCNTCPKVAGTYALTWSAFQAETTDCAQLMPPAPPGTLVLRQSGSVLRTTLFEQEYSGTLLDTFDFTLNGADQLLDGGSESLQVRARYLPGASDAGGSLRGTFETSSRMGSRQCLGSRPFTGDQQ